MLRNIGGDEELLRTLYGLFLKDIPKQTEALQQAIVNNASEDIIFHTHSLKGMCLNVTAESCSDIAKQIEAVSREGNITRIGPLFKKFEQELARVEELIRQKYPDV